MSASKNVPQQKHGKEQWLMQGMFRANGGCGYVKKPDIVMQNLPNRELFDPKRTLPEKKTILKVTSTPLYYTS